MASCDGSTEHPTCMQPYESGVYAVSVLICEIKKTCVKLFVLELSSFNHIYV